MIDIHSHILPGVDDGPATLEESAELAALYAEAGFKKVVATPHWVAGTRWMPNKRDICEKVDLLNSFLKESQIDITVYPGMEIAIDGELLKFLDKNEILSLAGKSYFLIEVPFQRLPVGWENLINAISSKGLRAILGHPERCNQLISTPELVKKIIDAGAYLQVNYDSFLGYYGPHIENMAFYLAEKGYIHCLATDSHDVMQRCPRNVAKAKARIEKRIGSENVHLMSVLNPERIFSDLPLKTPAGLSNNTLRKKRWHLL